MLQKKLSFPKNQKIYIQDKNDISEFIPIAINDPKESILHNLYINNYSDLSDDELESFYNVNPHIKVINKNNILNTKQNIFINPFQENNIELDKKIIYNITEEFRKLDGGKINIFEITKDKEERKKTQIKRQRNKIKQSKIKINKDDKCFPFNDPKGLTSYFDIKFVTKKYYAKENGKIRKIPKRRKFKSDDIRKKIKSRFHKELKNILNKNLKKCGSQKFFDYFPHSFISNVSKIKNSEYLNLTYKELLSLDFRKKILKDDGVINKIEHKKFLKNKEILDYLEQNPEISKLSGFSIIKDLKYKELLEKYFNSIQFEKSVLQLKNERESYEYIIKYIRKAKDYINFYSIDKFKSNEKDIINIEKIY